MLSSILRMFARQGANILLGLATTVLVARALGPEGNGIFIFCTIVLPPLLVTFSGFGVSYSNVYFVARGDLSIRSAYRLTWLYWAFLTPIGIVLGLLYIRATPPAGLDDVTLILSIAAFPPLLMQGFVASLLQARHDFRLFSYVTLAPAIIMLATLSIAFVATIITVDIAVAFYCVSQYVAAVYSFFVMQRIVRRESHFPARLRRPLRAYASYGFFSYVGNLIAFALQRMGYFFVGYFLGVGALGIFGVATQMSERLLVLVTSITTVALPRLAEQYSRGDSSDFTTALTRMTVVATVVVAAVVGLISETLVSVLFGAAFSGAVTPLLVLLPSTVFSSVARILANDLTARGRQSVNVLTSAFILVVNAGLCLWLTFSMGLIGAALATTLTSFLNCAVKLEVYRRISGGRLLAPVAVTSNDARRFWALAMTVLQRATRGKTRH